MFVGICLFVVTSLVSISETGKIAFIVFDVCWLPGGDLELFMYGCYNVNLETSQLLAR